jgi:hypothetical protein
MRSCRISIILPISIGLPNGRSAAPTISSPRRQPKSEGARGVITQKYRGPDDNEAAYTAHLREPRAYEASGKHMISEVRYTKRSDIGRFSWVDSLHYQSEVPNYLTRYLATMTSHLGILVTFSVYKDDYEATVGEFEDMIKSLKVHQH